MLYPVPSPIPSPGTVTDGSAPAPAPTPTPTTFSFDANNLLDGADIATYSTGGNVVAPLSGSPTGVMKVDVAQTPRGGFTNSPAIYMLGGLAPITGGSVARFYLDDFQAADNNKEWGFALVQDGKDFSAIEGILVAAETSGLCYTRGWSRFVGAGGPWYTGSFQSGLNSIDVGGYFEFEAVNSGADVIVRSFNAAGVQQGSTTYSGYGIHDLKRFAIVYFNFIGVARSAVYRRFRHNGAAA